MKLLVPKPKRAPKTPPPACADLERQVAELSESNAALQQSNAELVQERRALRTLIDNLPDYIFIKDRQSRFLVNNLAHARVLGAAQPDEVTGKSDLDIFPAELAKQYFADEQALMEAGQPLDREETVVDPKTGETRWLQTTKTPLRDKEGKVIGLAGISRDITHRKQAEEALTQSQRLLQALLDNIPDWIYFKDTQSRFLKCSKTHAKRLGVEDPEQAVGKTDFFFHPSATAQEFHEDEQRILQTGQPLINKIEKKIKPGGEVMWMSTTKVPMRDEHGTIVGLVGVNRDVTEQKQAEEALRQTRDELEKRVAERTAEFSHERRLLRTLIDNLPDFVFVKDAESRFTVTNMACARQLGAKHPDEVLGKSDADFVAPELAVQYRADELTLMHSGKPVNKEEPTQHKGTGQMRWSLTTKVPLKDDAGNVVGLMGIARDITDRKQTEEALARERLLLRTLIDNLPD